MRAFGPHTPFHQDGSSLCWRTQQPGLRGYVSTMSSSTHKHGTQDLSLLLHNLLWLPMAHRTRPRPFTTRHIQTTSCALPLPPGCVELSWAPGSSLDSSNGHDLLLAICGVPSPSSLVQTNLLAPEMTKMALAPKAHAPQQEAGFFQCSSAEVCGRPRWGTYYITHTSRTTRSWQTRAGEPEKGCHRQAP